MRKLLSVAGVLGAVVVAYVAAVWFGLLGRLESPGSITTKPRSPESVAAHAAREHRDASALAGGAVDKQILFGDLHVHTTYSVDAFLHSLPLMQGEGTHPPADACDFARFCSGLDFFSLNDHAESLDARRWRETKESIRACNAVAGDPSSPDLVAFIGWEWTQMGETPETHYGHKNVIFRDLRDDEVPTRPIAARGRGFDAMHTDRGRMVTLAMAAADFGNRQRYFDFGKLRQSIRDTTLCPEGIDVHDLPPDCAEAVATPRELFEKLAQWGFDSLVIPHGNTWGNTTPAGVTWDGQLADANHDPQRQRLIEVYSGHGNSEQYRSWRHVRFADDRAVCPEPSVDFLPACWRAGEIIAERCRAAGIAEAECEHRAAEARERYLAAGDDGRFVVPAATAADWLDAGQCRDCFQPSFNYRPGASSQYALATGDAGVDGAPKSRFRFGFIASSDNHSARAGTGYKELAPLGMTDMWGVKAQQMRAYIEPRGDDPAPESVAIDPKAILLLPGGDTERTASFYYTGGLVAVHARGRGRAAIWDALKRREVYGTSGPRILLWFDLVDPGSGESLPMGGETARKSAPRFRVRALGALEQRPGCPVETMSALPAERVQVLCKGECYYPGERRLAIARIEVVRIRPRRDASEDVAELIEDPWRVFPCKGAAEGCMVEFDDPEFAPSFRDAIYYVRAIQEPTPQINGGGLRCRRNATGACVEVDNCSAGGKENDDCLGMDEARAWSSPIFVDYSDSSS